MSKCSSVTSAAADCCFYTIRKWRFDIKTKRKKKLQWRFICFCLETYVNIYIYQFLFLLYFYIIMSNDAVFLQSISLHPIVSLQGLDLINPVVFMLSLSVCGFWPISSVPLSSVLIMATWLHAGATFTVQMLSFQWHFKQPLSIYSHSRFMSFDKMPVAAPGQWEYHVNIYTYIYIVFLFF